MAPKEQRYERVPQVPDDLFSLHTVSDNYNYGSGVPSSPPPSFHSSANIRPSIPSTHSAPGAFTPSGTSNSGTPSYHTARHPLTSSNLAALPENDVVPAYPFNRGDGGTVAETLVDGQTIADGTVLNDGASTSPENAIILNLHKRISQLETSVGRLLLQNDDLRLQLAGNEECESDPAKKRGANCCVTFSNDDEEVRRMMRGRDNCCVAIGSGQKDREKKNNALWIAGLLVLVMVFILLIIAMNLIFGSSSKGNNPPGVPNPGKGH